MALDAATYGRVEEAEKNILNNLNDVKTTVDTLPDKVGEKLDPVQTDMAQLVENVQKQVDELREIVEKSPAGIPAPCLAQLSAQSTDEGILLTYNPYVMLGEQISSYNYTEGVLVGNTDTNIVSKALTPLTITKGVMVRYSTESYPFDIDEGTLAFIDEDLYDRVENGSTILNYRKGKIKSSLVVGLSQNETYYFSAFPYSDNNVYNKQLGQLNTTSCQWTGTKGTLTVNVTQDYDYKPLGEYTATMTPTAGGQAITKTQSGAATIVFSGLEAGEYTLSFSAPQYFTAPSSQSVTVVAGQSQTVSATYILTLSLDDLSWDEVKSMIKSGQASKIFSVGDSKTIKLAFLTWENSSDGTQVSSQTYDVPLTIVKLSSNRAEFFTTKVPGIMDSWSMFPQGVCQLLDSWIYPYLPEDLKNVITFTSVYFPYPGSSSGGTYQSCKLYTLFNSNLGLPVYDSREEQSAYPYFTSASRRQLSYSKGGGATWFTRSLTSNNATDVINTSGASTNQEAYSAGAAFCFSIS